MTSVHLETARTKQKAMTVDTSAMSNAFATISKGMAVLSARHVVMHNGRPVAQNCDPLKARDFALRNLRHLAGMEAVLDPCAYRWTDTGKLVRQDTEDGPWAFTGWEVLHVPFATS